MQFQLRISCKFEAVNLPIKRQSKGCGRKWEVGPNNWWDVEGWSQK